MSNPKMPDLGALMKQAQKLQGDVQRVQEELAKLECEGAAGGGLVTAAINAAGNKVRETSKQKMSGVMGGMAGMPGMPGLF